MPEIGDLVVEKYRLERLLGQGGMASVYEATHVAIGKGVAIKFLRPDLWANAEQLNRFHREAQAAATVGHEGIIDIHDLGVSEDGAPFLVMELLEGRNLGEVLGLDGTVELSLATYVTCQVLSALDAAHRAGVVHRDLKPDNIFLVERGAALPAVKLLDFGISRLVGPGSGDLESIRLTQTGALMGTPVYMSPEQAQGLTDIDHRTDIYAASAVFFECLTGKPPLTADNYNALIARILTDTVPPISKWRTDLPPELERVVIRGLEKDRLARYQHAGDMLLELLPFLDESARSWVALPDAAEEPDTSVPTESTRLSSWSGEPTMTAPTPSTPKVAWGLALAGALLVLLLAGFLMIDGSEQSRSSVVSNEGDEQRSPAAADGGAAADAIENIDEAIVDPGNEGSMVPTSEVRAADLENGDGSPANIAGDPASEVDVGDGGPPVPRTKRIRAPGHRGGVPGRVRAEQPRRDGRIQGRLGTKIHREYEKG